MIQIDQTLTKNLWDEMVKYHPFLSQYFITNQRGELNFGLLGDLLISNLPWPIGVELRRLFCMKDLDHGRLDHYFKIVERTMQFFSFVMISQAVEERIKNRIEIPDTFRSVFQERFKTLSMGNFSWLIRSVGNFMSEQQVEWFMPEVSRNCNNKFYAELDKWVAARNEISHYQFNLTQSDIEIRCVNYAENLTELLKKLAFLAKYQLVSVQEIMVIKSKIKDARFRHLVNVLYSSNPLFSAQELDEEKFSESNSVLLTKTIDSMEKYLNLSPLIIDTSNEKKDAREKFKVEKDIFMYSRFHNDQLMYVGTSITEKCDLRPFGNYDVLCAEYEKILSELS
jgi:hypothetical protein